MSYLGEDDPLLVDIRRRAQDAGRAQDWQALLAMESELRSDPWWLRAWAPMCAIAAAGLDRDGRSYLEEAVAGGFSQPELFEPELSRVFAGDEHWPRLLAAMRANVPLPPVSLVDWPVIRPSAPLRWDRLAPEREELLRQRVLRPKPAAWETALSLLTWVTDRWQHANDHVASRDAVTILERVDAGERFACVEYTAVLSQALNALGVPARSVQAMQDDYHTGVGKAHQVTEAWIDEFASWVVLDGQNGMYWVDSDGEPLGVRALQDRCHASEQPPRRVCLGSRQVDDDRAVVWFSHFRYPDLTGAAWRSGDFVPGFQDGFVTSTEWLLRDRDEAYPDLCQVGVGVSSQEGRPALRFHTIHPYAAGFAVGVGEDRQRLDVNGTFVLPVDRPAGDHVVTVAVRTPYAVLRDYELTFRIES